jgi:RNA polymerase sigma-70 factor (ECF subfamily)
LLKIRVGDRIRRSPRLVIFAKANRVSGAAQQAAFPGPSGDGAASAGRELEDAFARHQAEIMGTLCCITGNAEDARDCLQETFIKCWRKRESYGEIRNVRAWIFRVALNTARDMRQSAWNRRRKAWPEGDAGDAMDTASTTSPHAQVQQSEDLARLRQELSNLRAEEQEVFLLRQNGELTYEEIAAELDIPTGTVKTRMRLALARLRKALGDA